MESKFSKRPLIPIASTNVKYLGLSVPEWAIEGVLATFFSIIFGSYKNMLLPISIQVFVTVFYIIFLSKLEENVLFVLIANRKIGKNILGFYNRKVPVDIDNDNR